MTTKIRSRLAGDQAARSQLLRVSLKRFLWGERVRDSLEKQGYLDQFRGKAFTVAIKLAMMGDLRPPSE